MSSRLLSLVVLGILVGSGLAAAYAKDSRPNILFIMSDDKY